MIFINELKPMKIYRKKFFLPIDKKDKKHGNAVLLLTPNYLSSKGLMDNPMTINRRYYESYYMQSDVNYYIKSDYKNVKSTVKESYIREEVASVDKEITIRDTDVNFDIATEFEKYYISEDKDIDSIVEEDWSDSLKDAINKTLGDKVKDRNFYVYIGKDDSIVCLGTIHVHYYSSSHYDYEWLETASKIDKYSRYKKESIKEGIEDNRGIIKVTGFESDVDEFTSNLEDGIIRKIADRLEYKGILPNINFTIIPYLDKCNIGVAEDLSYIQADFINKKAFDELSIENLSYKQFIEDIIEFIIRKYIMGNDPDSVEEAARTKLLRFDMEYLTKHLKYVANKGKYKMNELNRNVKKANTPPKIDPSTGSADNQPSKDEPTEVRESLIRDIATDIGNGYVLFEDNTHDAYLKSILYKDRIKQYTAMAPIYKNIKAELPFIKYAYIAGLSKYEKRNVFIDLSYYNEIFFRHNTYTLDRGVKLYAEFLERMIKANIYSEYGYSNTTIFIPVNDWDINNSTKMWLYKDGINPISMIYRLMEISPSRIKSIFGDKDIIFFGRDRYFRMNMSLIDNMSTIKLKFKRFILALRNNAPVEYDEMDDTPTNKETHDAIVNNIADKLEDRGLKVSKQYNLIGDNSEHNNTGSNIKSNKAENNEELLDRKKEELMKSIDDKTKDANNTEDALDIIDNDEEIKKLIMDIAAEEEDGINISKARSIRMDKISNESLNKEIRNTTVRELLDDTTEKEIPTTTIPVSINKDEWKDMTYINFDNDYDIDKDLIKIIKHLEKVSYPIIMRDVKVEDISTPEDYIDLYTFNMEDYAGRRFNIVLEIPKFENGYYLYLRGARQTIQSQLFNMPIIKTDQETCQIITNYRKIFMYRYGRIGKSTESVDRIIRCLKKYKGRKLKLLDGNCSSISGKYNLPMDYMDLGRYYHAIETPNYIIYFDQDKLRNDYKVDDTKGLPYMVRKKDKEVQYYYETPDYKFSDHLLQLLCQEEPSLEDTLKRKTPGIGKYNYTRCRIMEYYIPTVILTGHAEGLSSVLKKANVSYTIRDRLDKDDKNLPIRDYIKFKDAYLVYNATYESSLLMNGLKIVNTEDISIGDIDKRTTFLYFLDDIGMPRTKVDGLENFIDCMIDPITEMILKHYKMPTDYVSVLLYANSLLSDNKYINHTDSSTRRIRRQELIAAKAYKCIMTAYGNYASQIRHTKTTPDFGLKRSAVIDLFLTDYTTSNASVINVLNDVETLNAVTYKGESGLNNDRSYSLDKRTFDNSMLNVLGMSTGFAGNVGITRAATIDMSIQGDRGFIKPINDDMNKLSSTKTLTMTEALNPMGSNHDDPFRTAMTFIQSAKHEVRVDKSDPLLVTNGADEAIAYISSDIFAHKAKGDGKVTELNDEYMIIKYKDGNTEYIDLRTKVEKNADAGFWVPLKLDVADKIKVGSTVKKGTIVAYDKKSFSNNVGESDNIAYNVGTLAKVAILPTDEGFEDSTIVTEDLSVAMATDIIDVAKLDLNKNTNVYNLVKIGTDVEEGDELLVYQDAYEEEDAVNLMKRLADDEETVTSLGRRKLTSEVSGKVVDIKIYRTVDLNELSPTLKKMVKQYEAPINELKDKLAAEGVDTKRMRSTNKLATTGKLKATDGVYIEIYIIFHDVMKVGDKIVFDRANKGVIKDLIASDLAPTTEFRPNEKIHALSNISSFNNRMVVSVLIMGAINKLLVELDRSVKDILDIPYDDSKP